MKVKISEDSKKAVALRLPRGEQTFPVCAEQLFQILGKTKTIFRKGPAIYEIIDYPIEMQVLTPINLVARADKYCFTYILASAPKAKQSAASKTKKLIPKRCRMFIEEAKILLGTAEARRYLPNIRVATNAPVLYLHKDKLQIATTGYNPLCEVYVLEGVKDLPVMGSVQKAQATLLDLISEFNFATAGDQARAYAAMIAPALKFGGILTSPFPMDYSEADKSQSGKSLRHRMIHTIYHETPFVIPQKTKGLGSYEENLSNGLLSGKAFIIHDNFTGDLRLPVLESAIKGQGIIGARVFGKEEMQVPTYDVIYQMSSNDASIGMDLANRSMIVRLVKHPPTHKFKRSEHELIAQIEKEREVILASIFTLIKDRWKRGSPRGDLIEHTFPEYYAVMDWFCQDAGLVPIDIGHSKEQARIAKKEYQWIREEALAALEQKKPEEFFTCTELAGLVMTGKVKYPPNLSSNDSYVLARHIGQIFQQEFTKQLGQHGSNGELSRIVIDDIQISRREQKDDKSRKQPVFNFIRSNQNVNLS